MIRREPKSNVIYTFIPESGVKLRCTFEGYDEKGRVALRNVESGFISKISKARFTYMHTRFLVSEITLENNSQIQDNLPEIVQTLRKVNAVKSEKIRQVVGLSPRALAQEIETVFIKDNCADANRVKILSKAYKEALNIVNG